VPNREAAVCAGPGTAASNPDGYGQPHLDAVTIPNGPSAGSPWVRTSLAVGAPLLALIVAGGYVWAPDGQHIVEKWDFVAEND
jgi:hypothetical protein